MSSALIWHLVRNNNSFLVKKGRSTDGTVQFSSEPGNVLGVNSWKYSGLANERTVDVTKDLTLLSKNDKALNKPSTLYNKTKLNLHAKKSLKKIADLKSTRGDLNSAAQHKYKKLARASAKGSKKVVKSSRRGVK